MKKNLFSVIAIIATILFTSCYQVCYDNPLDNRAGQVAFTGTVGGLTTRVSGTNWSDGNQIGVFAINATSTGLPLAGNIFNNHANVMFHTPQGNGHFSVGASEQTIVFPTTGFLDFIAYYPFYADADITTFTLPIPAGGASTTNQANLGSPGQADIDILWARANGAERTHPTVQLPFARRMSQLRLTVEAGDGINYLTGLTAAIDGLLVNGSMNLGNGTITPSGTADTITPHIALQPGNEEAIVTAILLPGQNLNNATIRFTLDGKVHQANFLDQLLASGNQYNFTIQISLTGAARLYVNSPNIKPWDPVYPPGGDIITTPVPTFTADVTDIELPAAGAAGLTSTVEVSAADTQAWIVASSEGWLTFNTGGTGNAPFDVIAEPNTGGKRTATVTITPTAPTGFQPIEIEVTQAAASTIDSADLLFPGSDFADWGAFTGTLRGTTNAAVRQSILGAQDNSSALWLNGTFTSNTLLFTADLPGGDGSLAGMNSITFDMNGVVSQRSLVVTLCDTAGFTSIWSFNLLDLANTGGTITSTGNTNSFGTSTTNLDTGGNWVTVTLDLTGLDLSQIGSFQIRTGGITLSGQPTSVNVLIDSITIQ